MVGAVAVVMVLLLTAFTNVSAHSEEGANWSAQAGEKRVALAAFSDVEIEMGTQLLDQDEEEEADVPSTEASAAVAGMARTMEEASALAEDAGEEDPEETEEAEEEENYFENRFLATVVTSALNVREEPDTDSKWVGRLYKDCGGVVLEAGEEWTKIESGSVTGWVSNDYIVTGEEAQALALEDELVLVIEVETEALKVRSEPTTEEDNKIRPIYEGETYPVVSEIEDWVEIEYSAGKTGWVSAEYVSIRYGYEYATSRTEIEAEEAAAKAAAAAKNQKSTTTTTRSATAASVDDATLLACLIQCESGSYEGELAVANVVLNRVHSGSYPNSISGVIYQSGQFGPASSGQLASRIAKGPSSTALRAANDALAGTNNIGSYLHFRSASKADTSAYSSYSIVGGNLFY